MSWSPVCVVAHAPSVGVGWAASPRVVPSSGPGGPGLEQWASVGGIVIFQEPVPADEVLSPRCLPWMKAVGISAWMPPSAAWTCCVSGMSALQRRHVKPMGSASSCPARLPWVSSESYLVTLWTCRTWLSGGSQAPRTCLWGVWLELPSHGAVPTPPPAGQFMTISCPDTQTFSPVSLRT